MLKRITASLALILCFVCTSLAADLTPIKLQPPDTKGGKPLMQCLKDRKTDRAFSPKKLPLEVLSNLLWAAAGINRPESAKRTAPSARNWQEIDVYVAMPEGLYVYNAHRHAIDPVIQKDLRKATTQFFQPSRSDIEEAPIQLIYVADYAKMTLGTSDDNRLLYSGADTAFMAQNVYLYCSSEGLVTGVRALVDRNKLAREMKLKESQHIVLVQAVGYPR